MPYLEELMRESREKKGVEREGVGAPASGLKPGERKKILVDSYGEVKIYKEPGEPLLLYEIPAPHYRGEEKKLIDALMDIAISVIPPETIGLSTEELRKKYFQKVMEIIDATPELRVPVHLKEFYANAVMHEMAGFGLIDALTQDDQLEEIMVVGQGKPVYVYHRKYEMMRTNIVFYEEKDIIDLIDRIARGIGRRIDTQVPLLDARLKDGTRVNATLPPATIDGPTLTLRKFRRDPMSVIDLINFGTLDYEVAAFLWLACDGMGVFPANILVSGGAASGKTTSLNVLCSFIPNSERIVTIEDTAELGLPLSHWIRCEVRPPSIEGTGEIDMNTLLKNALRMRPDRVIVGEIRGAEGYTLFAAMNIGHRGAVASDTLIQLSDGRIKQIQELAEEYFSSEKIGLKDGFEFVELSQPIKVISWNKKTLQLENKIVKRIWRKRVKQKLLKITLLSGKTITLTKDHPLYSINEGINEIGAGQIKENDYLALPACLPVECNNSIFQPCLAGLVYGDGYIDANAIQFVNKDAGLVSNFEDLVSEVSTHKISMMPHESFTRCGVWDRQLTTKFREAYGIPFGNKTKVFKLNDSLLTSNEDLARFLRGLFDCDGWVGLEAGSACFSTTDPDLANKMPLLLLRFGIKSSTYAAKKDGKGNPCPYYKISIYGKKNLEKFASAISFNHGTKKRNLMKLLKKPLGAEDLFPNLSLTLKKLRKETGLTQEQLAKKLGAGTRSIIETYETGVGSLSRRKLLELCSVVETPLARQLKLLAESPIYWDKVKKIEEVDYHDYIYDLTVEDNHTYVANGIIVSNCFGTVHANSASETLIRLANPPISVPPIMLSSLNFIIMQNRIHDRRKGTIRRITELAEVTAVEADKPQMQVLYSWDPVKDALFKTGVECAYLQTVMRFTGLGKQEIEKELRERENILKELNQRGVRALNEVCEVTQNYVLKKKGA